MNRNFLYNFLRTIFNLFLSCQSLRTDGNDLFFQAVVCNRRYLKSLDQVPELLLLRVIRPDDIEGYLISIPVRKPCPSIDPGLGLAAKLSKASALTGKPSPRSLLCTSVPSSVSIHDMASSWFSEFTLTPMSPDGENTSADCPLNAR